MFTVITKVERGSISTLSRQMANIARERPERVTSSEIRVVEDDSEIL